MIFYCKMPFTKYLVNNEANKRKVHKWHVAIGWEYEYNIIVKTSVAPHILIGRNETDYVLCKISRYHFTFKQRNLRLNREFF